MNFVLTPAGFTDPEAAADLAIAASRAGAAGILNAELGGALTWVGPALDRLARFGGPAIGAKLVDPDGGLLAAACGLGIRLGHLVVDPPTFSAARETLAAFRQAGGKVAVELTDWTEEAAALCGHVDALWLKGHEAGGWVGEQTAFILLQKLFGRTALPLFVRGGINERSAAACAVGGAAGVVLDDQLLLLRESPLAGRLGPKLRHFSGIETVLIEQYGAGPSLRIWPEPGRTEARLLAAAVRGAGGIVGPEHAAQLGWADGQAAPLGQDGVVARAWSERYGSVAAALRGLAAAVAELPGRAAAQRLCGPDTKLARSHGTRYPIVQGPMTHVSDRVDFIEAVAAGGALPMVAVSLMRGAALRQLLGDTRDRLGTRPWGVGMLGFVPAEILQEQRDAVRETRPGWAVIAGGRPDQARELEAAGIRTYLHVPSPALLTQFLDQGARHFIFEGRECGGHIGPLASFVLWGQMVDALFACDLPAAEREKIHVLLAGGIHDARSSAMAAVMAAPLAERGIASGVLMGTGYIFTREAVAGTAITPEFQRIVIEGTSTVGLVTGAGHASRCVVTPFVDAFWRRGRELGQAGASPEEVRAELEELSLGRLRLASKGVIRARPDQPGLREAPVEEQRDGGMYMIGQACVLRDRPTTVADLHHDVGEAAQALLDAAARPAPSPQASAPPPADVAIVGISAIFPGAADVNGFWENILAKVCALEEIPADRWDWRGYFDEDRDAPDKIYSKWGGFMPAVPFDPTRFGMPPVSVKAVDPMQLLALVAVEAALKDAGMSNMAAAERELTSVILGITGGLGELGLQYGARSELSRALGSLEDAAAETLAFLPQWTSDSFAGLLPNVTAGRVANRFDFGGVNFTVDAACAASLAALRQGVLELETGRSGLVICGGVDTVEGPFGFTCFSKAGALSPTGRVRTFDAAADGTTISEGVAMLVLKRLADAERDGDRIYAVIKGMGGSSDGRQRGLMAPLPAGQIRALSRAYAQAGYSPATVDLFEAHGTGTVAGDAAEIESLSAFLRAHGAQPRQSAVGSVKTMIGHTKATAGIAGLIKATLGLHHRVLPPHMGVERPNPALLAEDSPIGLVQQMQPWLSHSGYPRRAGVSAFGFGGTNFHVALEEYQGDYRSAARPAPRKTWPAELFVWRAADRAVLAAAAAPVLAALEAGATPALADLAEALARALPAGRATLAIVADSHAALRSRLADALAWIAGDGARKLPVGVQFSDTPLAADGKLAMLCSGQGSQYPDMLCELAACFDEVRTALEAADAIVAETPTYRDRPERRLSRLIYPSDRFDETAEKAARQNLAETDAAQPALGAVGSGLLALASSIGLRADMVGGHSYGEYVALHAAGVLDRHDLLLASEARGRFIRGAAQAGDLGTMAAVAADEATVRAALGESDVVLANFNAPAQTVISGARSAIESAMAKLGAAGLQATRIPVAAAFHSPLMQPAQEPLVAFFAGLGWHTPAVPVYANATAAPHDSDPEKIRDLLGRHLTEPVRFLAMIEAMHAAGARVFLEIGPKSVLADLTRRILGDQPHRAVSFDGAGGGIVGFLHALAGLVVEGVPVALTRLFRGRVSGRLDLARLAVAEGCALGPNTWLLTGTRARRLGEAFPVSAARAQPRVAEPLPPAAPGQAIAVPPAGGTTHASHMEGNSMDGIYLNGPDGPVPHDGTGVGLAYGPASGADRTMAEYYQTMRQFLQVQERLMLAYLNAADPGPRSYAAPISVLAAPLAASPTVAPPAAAPLKVAPVAVRPPPPAPPIPVAPVAVAPPPPAPPPAAAATVLAADPKTLLLEVASERTGYPQDMLDLDLNMEADLGIDSIKRVEILGAFRLKLPAASGEALSGRMDELSKAKSLQEILNLVASVQGAAPRPFEQAGTGHEQAQAPLSRPPLSSHDSGRAAPPRAPLARYVITPWVEPLDADGRAPLPGGLYIVVPDRLGVAAALAGRLEREGVQVRLVPDPVLASEDTLGRWLGTIRAEDRIRAVIDLRPVRRTGESAAADDLAAWQAGMATDVKALFPMLRLCANDLGAGGLVLVGSGMGGYFGRDALRDPRRAAVFPGAGGGVGLLKCLTFEWHDCRCKAIDLDLDETAEQLAAHLHDELARGGRREAGYPAGVRTIFRTVPASLIPLAVPRAAPDRDWVVLAIGGARGITAETLREFAICGATCVVVGRSAPPGAEDKETRDCADAAALRSHFVARARAAGERAKPAALEARVAAVLRDREITANLADFARTSRVDTRVCDVRQESEVAALLADLYATYGRIDAVLFGAGLIEDQLLVNKTQESLSRVFDTKVDGAWLIARHLRPETLKFVAFFTSVAGRYGNPGQTDYGAANEVLNRFAWTLQALWGPSVKVTAINWGPWARTTHGPGMLTPETARQFSARGVNLIEPAEGSGFLIRELLYAPRDEVEVVAGEHPWEYKEAAAARGTRDMRSDSPPLLAPGRTAASGAGKKLFKTIDLVSDPYLDDHRIDGQPVLPMACAAEYLAEAATALAGRPVHSLTGVRSLRGLVLGDTPLEVELGFQPAADGASAAMQLYLRGPKPRLSYSATAHFGPAPALAPSRILATPVAPARLDITAIYRDWLFHGPRFQTVHDLILMSPDRIVATGQATRPESFYPPAGGQEWIFDPGIVDGVLQTIFAWSLRFRDAACLPTSFGRIARFGDGPLVGEYTLAADFLTGLDDPMIRCRCEVVDPEGRIRLAIDDVEAWIDPKLKRLSGGWSGGVPARTAS